MIFEREDLGVEWTIAQCDGPDCEAEIGSGAAADLLLMLKQQGWLIVDEQKMSGPVRHVYCPECQPPPTIRWQDITPADAIAQKINLHERLDITAPRNEAGERCPWPWDPQQLVGAPLGQYHCGYCGAMVVAGVEHIDYADAWANAGPPEPGEVTE